MAALTPGRKQCCRMFSAFVPSQKWNKLPTDRPFIEHICLHQCEAVMKANAKKSFLFTLLGATLVRRAMGASSVSEVLKDTLFLPTTSGRRDNRRRELFNYSRRRSARRSRAEWLDYTKWDRSHLWARKLRSARTRTLPRRPSSHSVRSLVKFERWVDCF